MKEYQKPELTRVDFAAESVTDNETGGAETGGTTVSTNVNNPWGNP